MNVYAYGGVLVWTRLSPGGRSEIRAVSARERTLWVDTSAAKEYIDRRRLSPRLFDAMDRVIKRDPEAAEISDGMFPSDFFCEKLWALCITTGVYEEVGALYIEDLRVDLVNAQIDADRVSVDPNVFTIALKYARGEWSLTHQEWVRVIKESDYAHYRITGSLDRAISELAPEMVDAIDAYGIDRKTMARHYVESGSWNRFRFWVNDELVRLWRKRHGSEYRRKRVVYVAGTRTEFRLSEVAPIEGLDFLDWLSVLRVGPDELVRIYGQRLASVHGGFESVMERPYDDGRLTFRELTTNEEFVEEGREMDHCVGEGHYFAECASGSMRVFAGSYKGPTWNDRFTVAVRWDAYLPCGWSVVSIYGPDDEEVDDETCEAFEAGLKTVMPVWVSPKKNVDIVFE